VWRFNAASRDVFEASCAGDGTPHPQGRVELLVLQGLVQSGFLRQYTGPHRKRGETAAFHCTLSDCASCWIAHLCNAMCETELRTIRCHSFFLHTM